MGSTAATAEMDEDPEFPRVTSKRVKRFVFLGTGTSGQVPAIGCLLPGPSSSKGNRSNEACRACHDAIRPGSKNRRGCCSLAIVVAGADSSSSSSRSEEGLILIDCGPTFYASAISHFARNGLRRIDAVLLTHAHADAILGLDNLRAWTMGGDIQSHVDIYCTQTCFETVEATFPYLVNGKLATGGGAVGELRFHIIDAQKPFQIPLSASQGGFSSSSSSMVEVIPLPMFHGPHGGPNGAPFECLGFRIDSLSYLSDTHEVPSTTSQLVAGSDVVIIDALNPYRHASHFSLQQALSFVLSLPPPSTSYSASTSTTTSSSMKSVREEEEKEKASSSCSHGPRLALLTDLTHNLEHHSTERELRLWNKELLRRRHLMTSKSASPNSALATTIKSNGRATFGEGGGPRWWSEIWDESESERLSGRRTLRLVDAFQKEAEMESRSTETQQMHDMSFSQGDAPSIVEKNGTESGAKENDFDETSVPQFHVAWDGLAIEMSAPAL